ncbi:type IV pilus twitching motility protein PilT [Nocardioides mangrovi]|uniref:Type IV pilus twitching motility protein PilT n=1 Tax=Nocardioides mangrovi TaxID=2874580 RepID=A0ABS7UJ18_9ACTN|nr:type IV pilus twitching motility protein PilT [Nocardioides mangrovi]MBZ5740024.1 type IV pilus twitching motility protein PilT [Nocardioides mangrovi]MBZ5740805.1 type IV pilus twitching motility protein PilT [Nocardioides mangrovi]
MSWAEAAPVVPALELDELLLMVERMNGSDLHLTAGAPPTVRVRGALTPVEGHPVIRPDELREALYAIMTERQRQALEETRELDLAYAVPGFGRFRVNIYWQRQSIGAVMRLIPWQIKPLAELGMPPVVEGFARMMRGLVLVTGPTGSGKSTTLASIIDVVNRTRHGHIMTIEDPIEFLHSHRGCLVNQREVGADTHDFRTALKHVLRQDPDVILVGELRDLETISVALTAAETGHLVLATLHTQSAQDTVSRVVDVFPATQQQQVRTQLAATLQGVVCQALVPTADGTGRIPATEIMVCNAGIRAMIRDDKLPQIPGALQSGAREGMQTMDAHLAAHVRAGLITREVGLEYCAKRDDFLALVGSGVSLPAGTTYAGRVGTSHAASAQGWS